MIRFMIRLQIIVQKNKKLKLCKLMLFIENDAYL
jgi:hypothetical protein